MLFSHDSDEAKAYAEVTGGKHSVPLSHQLIAAAASYEAAKKYAQHREKEGKPMSHEAAVKLLAGFTGMFVDRFVETKGIEGFHPEEAKREAHGRAEQALRQTGEY